MYKVTPTGKKRKAIVMSKMAREILQCQRGPPPYNLLRMRNKIKFELFARSPEIQYRIWHKNAEFKSHNDENLSRSY